MGIFEIWDFLDFLLEIALFCERVRIWVPDLKLDCCFGILVENKAFLYMGISQIWMEFCFCAKCA